MIRRAVARMYAALAKRHERAGRWPAAVAAYDAAVAWDDRHPGWFIRLAAAHVNREDWRSAARAYACAVARDDRHGRWFADLARASERAGDWADAAGAYEAAVARDDGHARWFLGLAKAYQRIGRWDAAAAAYESAVARDDGHAGWFVALAKAHERNQRWDAAARAYEGAVARDPGRADWFARLGEAHRRTGQWQAAARAYEASAARDDSDGELFVRMAIAYEHAGRWEAAARAYDAAATRDPGRPRWAKRLARARERVELATELERDPRATELDRRLLAANPDRFRVRREIAAFLATRIDLVRQRALSPPAAPERPTPRVYVFWGQGFGSAPPIVKRCLTELRRHHGEDEIVLLDAEGARDYVEIAPEIRASVANDWAKFSEVLRIELMASCGGIWMDATCLPRIRLLDVLPELTKSGMFAFTNGHAQVATWFLAAQPRSYPISLVREAQNEYYGHYGRPTDYFCLNIIIEALYHVDECFQRLWDATPRINALAAHRFQRVMLEPYSPQRFDRLLNGSFVHKLTYKVGADAIDGGSLLARLLDDGPPRTPPQTRVVAPSASPP